MTKNNVITGCLGKDCIFALKVFGKQTAEDVLRNLNALGANYCKKQIQTELRRIKEWTKLGQLFITKTKVSNGRINCYEMHESARNSHLDVLIEFARSTFNHHNSEVRIKKVKLYSLRTRKLSNSFRDNKTYTNSNNC